MMNRLFQYDRFFLLTTFLFIHKHLKFNKHNLNSNIIPTSIFQHKMYCVFNATNTCSQLHGQKDAGHHLEAVVIVK